MQRKVIRPFTTHEFNELIDNLKVTIAWTTQLSEGFDFENGNYATVFRQTNPYIKGEKLYSFEKVPFNEIWVSWNIDDLSEANYKLAFSSANDKRRRDLKRKIDSLDLYGRILLFQTTITTHDGAPITESEGFVDDGDIPPIDTWFYLKDRFYENGINNLILFSWIPKNFEKLIQNAIDVEILYSYDWLDEYNPKLNEEIFKYLNEENK